MRLWFCDFQTPCSGSMNDHLICLFGVKISFVFIPRTVRNMGWWWGLVPHHCWIFRWILEWKCEAGLPVPCSSSSRVALTQIWRHGVSCVAPRLRCSSTNLLRSTSVPRQVPNHSVAFQLFSVKSAFSIMKKFVGVRIFLKNRQFYLGKMKIGDLINWLFIKSSLGQLGAISWKMGRPHHYSSEASSMK